MSQVGSAIVKERRESKYKECLIYIVQSCWNLLDTARLAVVEATRWCLRHQDSNIGPTHYITYKENILKRRRRRECKGLRFVVVRSLACCPSNIEACSKATQSAVAPSLYIGS
jgi:hypothetical protein